MKQGPRAIKQCRISGSANLIPVLHLGNQALTGVFPKSPEQPITVGPLDLVWCPDSGLLQLGHSYDLEEMYGMNYGYRSGLNQSMVRHLKNKVNHLNRLCPVVSGDIVLDIGSNDATLLSSYQVSGLKRIGIDPTGVKFKDFYTDGIELVPDFFSAQAFKSKFPNGKAKIVTSISMFYDLESPRQFVQDIFDVLDDNGIWHLEQSYMPAMLRTNSYDTVCHEHLEYYSLEVVKNLLDQCGLKVIDVQMNAINGGSFAVTATKKTSCLKPNDTLIEWLLGQEYKMGLHTPKPYRDFEERVYKHRDDLTSLIHGLNADGKKVVGYGASTKGNVLLQFCGLNDQDLAAVAEVNPDKFGAYTPGTNIPILSEKDVKAMNPDYMLVLPWHFRQGIVEREAEYLASGGKLIFPLPEIEIV
jgi:hypothetical protein